MRIQHFLSGLVIATAAAFVGCEPVNYEAGGDPAGSVTPAEEQTGTEPEAPVENGGEAAAQPAGEAEESQASQPAESPASDIVDTAVAAGNFTTLAAALQAGGLVETLKSEGPFTVFAPTDEAFGKLPEGTVENLLKPENKDQLVAILTYHVVAGKVDAAAVSELDTATTVNGAALAIDAGADGVRINESNVTTADIACSNGIIHVIDAVLLPPSAEGGEKPHSGEPLSIDGVGSFKTLFAAIEAAGLKETLENDGPFTIFAPTDEAFAALPEGTLDELLKPENKDKLVSILTYHVVKGEVPSSQVAGLSSAKTVNGAELAIQVTDGTVQVGDAQVLKTDIPCEVGLIHAIDKVLLP